jgi:hypothetical protein
VPLAAGERVLRRKNHRHRLLSVPFPSGESLLSPPFEDYLEHES